MPAMKRTFRNRGGLSWAYWRRVARRAFRAGGGVARYRTFDGVLHELLLGPDGAPLQGADGYYLYGVA